MLRQLGKTVQIFSCLFVCRLCESLGDLLKSYFQDAFPTFGQFKVKLDCLVKNFNCGLNLVNYWNNLTYLDQFNLNPHASLIKILFYFITYNVLLHNLLIVSRKLSLPRPFKRYLSQLSTTSCPPSISLLKFGLRNCIYRIDQGVIKNQGRKLLLCQI